MLVLYLYVICEYSAAEKYLVTCYFGYTCRLIVKEINFSISSEIHFQFGVNIAQMSFKS